MSYQRDDGAVEVRVVDGQEWEVGRLAAEQVRLPLPPSPTRVDPATALDPDGRIWTAFVADPHAEHGIYSRGGEANQLWSSADGGRTWERQSVTLDGVLGGFGILPDGTFVALLSGTGAESGLAVARSTDEGRTWSAPAPLSADQGTRLGCDGNPFCPLPDGSVIVSACQYDPVFNERWASDAAWRESLKPEDYPDEALYQEFAYRSTDGGRTWRERDLVTRMGAETRFLSLGGGRVLAAIRWCVLWDHHKDGVESKRTRLSESSDYGRTWSPPRQVTRRFGDTPGELVRLSDGRIVLLHTRRYPYTAGHLRAQVSPDEGQTWSAEAYIVSEGHGYSGSVVLPDDTIVTVCGDRAAAENGQMMAERGGGCAVRWKLP